MSNYITTIGLEVHAELHTKSKMWCGCVNDPMAEKPNTNICEVCMAHPGTLPVANKAAIKKVVEVGLAIGANIADFTEFDRKNYFYPDIPKGYQLSQYLLPIVSGGTVNDVAITRVHLEEDTAKSSHENGATLVDYNRAGVPLMELVTEPVIHSAEQAGAFARELQRILRYVGASEANMDKGQMRVEANISVSTDPNKFGTKCEVKNLNSFRSVEEAIKFEVARHIDLIESGGKVVQETRGWDETKMETFSQRKKENANDYRYFPDPDLPKLYLSELFDIEELRKEIPKLPAERRVELTNLGIKPESIEIIINSPKTANYFDKIIHGKDASFALLASNYLVVDFYGLLNIKDEVLQLNKPGEELLEMFLPHPSSFIELIELYQKNELSSRGVKDLLWDIRGLDNQVNVKELAESKGLIQRNDKSFLESIVNEVIMENPTQVADYKSGKESMFMFFVGQCMKKSKGAGNPGLFQEILKEQLEGKR